MSKKKKLARFAENQTFPNMFQVSFEQLSQHPFHLKGNWNSRFFDNGNPLVLELGCGKGEYTIGLSRKYPEKNFIGMDIKGARMWKGCKTSQTENLSNVAFIRTRIELLEHFFAPNEVDEIWITFPDPQPRSSREKKRLTSPQFLKRYRNVVKPDGVIHLKTDDDQLYFYTLQVIENEKLSILATSPNIHSDPTADEVAGIKTYYENIWLSKGLSIKYIRYKAHPAP
ncbi:MAG: tRNA (guanosine(46)-N7)-methyltransferase TrmB [Bacteroidales bacterium]